MVEIRPRLRILTCRNLLRCLTHYNNTWQIIQLVIQVLDIGIIPQVVDGIVMGAVLLLWHHQRVVGHMAAQRMRRQGVEVPHHHRVVEEERVVVVRNVQLRLIIGLGFGHSRCLRICMDEERGFMGSECME